MKNILLSVLLILVPVIASAAPSVTGTSGAVTHGQNITISGSGFGTKSTAAPNLWDTVDNQSAYSGLSNGSTIPVGGSNPWGANYDSATTYRTTGGDQRGKSTANYYAANSRMNALGSRQVTGATYLYVSWWFKTATTIPEAGHSSKYLRVSDFDDIPHRTFSWTQIQAYVFEDPNYCANSWVSYSPSINDWHFFEAFFDSVNERFTLAVDGSTRYNNIDWSSASVTVLDDIDGIGFDGGGSSPPYITSWVDDIYVDSTPQRVMICSGSTWDSRGTCEMQIPSAWSDTSVTVTVNQGAFTDSSSQYLYVVDASGDGGTGRQITFGSSSAPTPTSGLTGVTTSGCTIR